MAEAALQRPSGRGKFISFEGGEGSGKSTQIKKLAERLAAAKLRAIVTREPGGSPGAEIIRHLVLSGMGKLLGPEAETLLFAAARDDHVRTVIQPALSQGTWVLCDRFSDSTRAYQGRLGQVSPGVLNAMQRVTIGDLKPDLTIILDIPVEVGLQRAAARRGSGAPDRFEAEDLQFHQDLRDAYRQIAADDPQRCVLIDANADADTVAARVWTRAARSSVRGPEPGEYGMSARKTEQEIGGQASARNGRSVRPSRGRDGIAECLSQRAHSACLADRRPAGHRQGDAGLSHGAVRARASQSHGAFGAARRDACARSGSIPSRARSRPAPMAGCWCWSAASTIAA